MDTQPVVTLTTLVDIKDSLSKLFDSINLNDRDEQELYMAFATINDVIKRNMNVDYQLQGDRWLSQPIYILMFRRNVLIRTKYTINYRRGVSMYTTNRDIM